MLFLGLVAIKLILALWTGAWYFNFLFIFIKCQIEKRVCMCLRTYILCVIIYLFSPVPNLHLLSLPVFPVLDVHWHHSKNYSSHIKYLISLWAVTTVATGWKITASLGLEKTWFWWEVFIWNKDTHGLKCEAMPICLNIGDQPFLNFKVWTDIDVVMYHSM